MTTSRSAADPVLRLVSVVVLTIGVAAGLHGQSSSLDQAWSTAARARDEARQGRHEQALALYERASAMAPDVAPIERDYAIALGWAGRYPEAAKRFRRVRALQPRQPLWALREMAHAELFAGSNHEAVELYDKVVGLGDDSEIVATRRALGLRRSGRVGLAAAAYREALERFPESDTAAVGVVECLLDAGRPMDAYEASLRFGKNRSPNAEVHVLRAWILLTLGRYDESLEMFDSLPIERMENPSVAAWRVAAARLAGDPRLLVSDVRQLVLSTSLPPLSPEPSTLASELPGPETGIELSRDAHQLRDEGVSLARSGLTDTGLAYVRRAIAMAPSDTEIRRDYAIVLNWAESYDEARRQFARVFREEPRQPVWTRSERAQAELFGGQPKAALEILDGLLAEGETNERNLVRKGLALRWMGNAGEAENVYRRVAELYPGSPTGPDGLIHSLADQNRLAAAIKAADRGLERLPDHWELLKSKAQVLNWAGRHLRARKALSAVPVARAWQSEVIHHRALAARWTEDRGEAMEFASQFRRRYPGSDEAKTLQRDLEFAYGYAVRSRFDSFSDSDGFSTTSQQSVVEIPASLAHRLQFSRDRRTFRQDGQEGWTSLQAGWTGALTRRFAADASVSQVRYRGQDRTRRLAFESGASVLLGDRARLRAGVGRTPSDAFQTVRNRTMMDYSFVELEARPTIKTEASVRVARYRFEESVTREVLELGLFRRLLLTSGMELQFGARSEWMRHDRASPNFFSPSEFRVHTGSVRASGRLAQNLDYVVEVGSGIQIEPGSPSQVPFFFTTELAKRLLPEIWLRFQTGYTNSSIDRATPGASSYRMKYLSAGIDWRIRRSPS